MAKRWDEDDDDLDIDLEFDRVEYMKKEINKGKSTLVAVAIAPIFAFVTMTVFTLTMDALISLATGMLGLIFLKPIYDLLNIDIDKIGKKGWVKNGGVYFLTLLAVWIILMNPPFADFAGPTLNEIELEFERDGDIIAHDNVSSGEEYNITIIATITDNTEVDHGSIRILIDGDWYDLEWEVDTHKYRVTFEEAEVEEENMEVTIEMQDVEDNKKEVSRNLPFLFTP